MAIKEILEGNTSKVLEATELLKELGDREGQFVWKKCKEVTKAVTNPSITLTKGANSTTLVESSDVDLSKVTEEFFGGFIFTGGDSWYFVYENNTLYYNAGSSRHPMTYDPTTQILTGYSDEGVFMYTGDKIAPTVEVIGCVVADSEDAYPNCGTLDGYWYELVNISDIGDKTFDVVTFTPSADTTELTIPHNLGSVPKYATIVRLDGGTDNDANYEVLFVWNVSSGGLYGGNSRYGSSLGNITSPLLTLSSDSVKFTSESSTSKGILSANFIYALLVVK